MAIDREIDARGLLCPLPVLRAGRALRALAPGQMLQIDTTDPMAVIDLPHFCTTAGHAVVQRQPQPDGATRWTIRRGPDQA